MSHGGEVKLPREYTEFTFIGKGTRAAHYAPWQFPAAVSKPGRGLDGKANPRRAPFSHDRPLLGGRAIRKHIKPDQRIFVGVVQSIDPPEEVRDRVLQAAKYIPLAQLGTTDDCGFSPFSDDTSTSRETAFAKIHARVVGTEMAAKVLAAG